MSLILRLSAFIAARVDKISLMSACACCLENYGAKFVYALHKHYIDTITDTIFSLYLSHYYINYRHNTPTTCSAPQHSYRLLRIKYCYTILLCIDRKST